MKRLLLITFLLLFGRAASQETFYNDDWHQTLESELEYICYQRDNNLCVRVYRGKSMEHTMSIYNKLGVSVYSCEFERASDVDLSSLSKGIYFLVVSNDKKIVTQKIFINN